MTREDRNNKLKHFITCLKCEVSGKCCDDNCSIQYDAGNMGEIIENLEAISKVLEQEPRWIPVSEKLPEKNMDCLVAVGEFNFTEIASYSDLMGIIDHRIFYQGDVGHDSFKNITKYVKAWMPLPKPYREVEE